MKKTTLFAYLLCATLWLQNVQSQNLKPFELTNDWISKIETLAPSKPRIPVSGKKNILIFSLHTGFKHWTIPHTEEIIKLIAEKSNAFNVTVSKDIAVFEKENLDKYDAIVLNNNCSIGDKRNLFWDVLKTHSELSDKEKVRKARKMETNLLKYIKKGNGIMLLHGAIVMQNKSEKFGKMVGGSFDYHPKQQKIHVKLVDSRHPLTQSFDAQGFTHIDEPYFFKNDYFNYNFKPLLYMETDKLDGLKKDAPAPEKIKYISWIKKYGKGKVFYSSPSHNAQSLENPKLLQFFLDGLQYITGDLKCDDSPMGAK